MSNTIGDLDILSCDLRMPRMGVWHADVEADGDTALSGAVVIDIEGDTFRGTIVRSDLNGGRVLSKVAAGAGGMATAVAAKHYSTGPTVKQVVTDILTAAGESLSATSDATILGKRLTRWDRAAGKASDALVEVLESQSATWRVLDDGTVWVGRDTYPTQNVEHDIIDEDWIRGIVEIAPTRADLRPAVTFDGQRVSYVVHRLRPGSLRSEAHAVDSPSNLLEAILGQMRRRVALSRTYPARVVQQNADGTLQLLPDDDKVKGGGLDRVPIRYGLPGFTATVPAGTRVRVGFDAGDASRPWAALWDEGDVTAVVFDGGTRPVAREGDLVKVFFPSAMAFSGFTGVPPATTPISGTLTITSAGNAIIAGGNPKLLA